MKGGGWKEKTLIKHYFYAKLTIRSAQFQTSDQGTRTMETKQAIISFSQGEKIKGGLIWCTQCVQMALNLPPSELAGAAKVIQGLVSMIANEVRLAQRASQDPVWSEVDKALRTAGVMVESGVIEEATYHFTQTLSQVNRISQKAMACMVDKGMFG
jgi:hypothetical protein